MLDLVGTRCQVAGAADDTSEFYVSCKWPAGTDFQRCLIIKVPLKPTHFIKLIDSEEPERWIETADACARAHIPSRKSSHRAPEDIPRVGFSGRVASGRVVGTDTFYKCYVMFWDEQKFERMTSIVTYEDLRSMNEEISMDPVMTVALPAFPNNTKVLTVPPVSSCLLPFSYCLLAFLHWLICHTTSCSCEQTSRHSRSV